MKSIDFPLLIQILLLPYRIRPGRKNDLALDNTLNLELYSWPIVNLLSEQEWFLKFLHFASDLMRSNNHLKSIFPAEFRLFKGPKCELIKLPVRDWVL